MEFACSETGYDRFSWRGMQCARAGKVERDGKWYCKQHDPVAVAERKAERDRKWRAECDAKDAARAEAKRQRELAAACVEAIKQIAAGHNDPRGLATEVLGLHLREGEG